MTWNGVQSQVRASLADAIDTLLNENARRSGPALLVIVEIDSVMVVAVTPATRSTLGKKSPWLANLQMGGERVFTVPHS